ncbi:MAG: hypothetical protein K9K21_11765 [Desulfotignum sp.]|nr:hypothetical protein [Desulfotignum sp.]
MEKKSRKMERMAYIGHLTASLSHEIRNPLSSVKMNLQILGKNKAFAGNDKRRLAISEREIHRLETILQQLVINLLLNALDSVADGGKIIITTAARHWMQVTGLLAL